jgi:DNA-binding NtrC family response regulator
MGAYDYVLKPFKIDELLITVERALNYKRAISENVDLKAQVKARYRFDSIVAESDAMRKVCEMIEHLAPTDTTLLITGEKGTGKALVARTVHDQSPRKDEPFFAVNCGKLAEEDMESKLFKGGQASPNDPEGKGLLIAAGRGTVYLGEIGSMSMPLQATLLQVLQDRSLNGQPVQARIMAGADVDLDRLVKEAKFREDLHNRLRAISMDIKPLRERREDVLPLVYRLLLAQVGEGNEVPSLAPDARMALMQYAWPENVAELDAALKHAFAAAEGGEIKKEHIPEGVTKDSGGAGKKSGPGGAADEYRGKSLKAFLRSKEKEYLESVLDHTKGDKEKAAKALKISLATLYRKLPGDVEKES